MIGTNGPTQSVGLRLRSGEVVDRPLPAGGHMELYAEAIHAGRPGLVEVVGAERTAERKLAMKKRRARENFLDAGDRAALRQRGEALSRARLEVFVTPATLTSPEPGNDAVAEAAVAWIDIDAAPDTPRPRAWPAWLGFDDAMKRLREFAHRPHMVVASGTGGMHAYWRLAVPVAAERGEEANRQLAAELGGDHQSTNRGRVMRLPGSRNRKAYPPRWCGVVMCDLGRAGYDVEELTAGLKDPKAPRRVRSAQWRPERDDPTKAIPPPAYFARLAGLVVDERGELISCPHPDHPDRDPSCMVYPNPDEGWYCFSCGAGGGPIDLVSALRGGPTGGELKGGEFKQAARECRERLGVGPGSSGAPGSARTREEVRG
jgi:RepB DNA-primase from phage plasmid